LYVQIQRNWRGYYVRKYIFNYRTYKEYLKGVMEINEIVRARAKVEQDRVEKERAEREEYLHEVREWGRVGGGVWRGSMLGFTIE
jgi:hypothetical protein